MFHAEITSVQTIAGSESVLLGRVKKYRVLQENSGQGAGRLLLDSCVFDLLVFVRGI